MHKIISILKKIVLSSFVLLSVASFGQEGTNLYPFLNIPISARQAALGGDAISVRDQDVSFAATNPAMLNEKMHQMVSLNVASYLADSKYGTLAYGRNLDNGHFASVHAKYMDFGSIPRTDESGETNGNFKAIDATLGVGYAFQFEQDWTVGANLNFISSKIDNYTSSAIAGSIGFAYHFYNKKNDKKKKNRVETLSVAFRNFGYQLSTYNGEREKLPFRIDLGYTRKLDEFPASITITAHDLQQFDISSEYNNNGQEVKTPRKILDHLSFGAEIFPDKQFNIRLGYNVKRGNELSVVDQRSFAGISAGFGVRFSNIYIDYAHSRYHSASNVHQVGISINLNKKEE